EWQSHMIQFKNRLGTYRTHVLDRVLVTNVVRPLDGVIHMPAPIIVRIRTSDCASNPALSRHRMGTSRKHFGDTGSLDARLSQLKRRAHTRTTTADNDGVIRQCS